MSIVTLDQAKQQLNIDPTDTSQDAELQQYVDGVTDAVEHYLGKVTAQRAVVDERELAYTYRFLLRNVPVISLTSVQTVDGLVTWDVANLHVNTETGVVTVLSGPTIGGLVAVTYQAGYATVPTAYVRGALVILQHNWETQRGVGAARAGVIGGEEHYDPRTSYSIPRKALEWLGTPLPGVA